MADETIEIIENDDEEKSADPELEGVDLLVSFFTTEKGVLIPSANIADKFSRETLMDVGAAVLNGHETDLDSMDEWTNFVENGLKLAKQEIHTKDTPWPGASNFKSPTLMEAALKFSDRASVELLRQEDIVKTSVIGFDESGDKAKQAERVAEYSNFQLNIDMSEWRDEHEKLLYKLPYDGTVFKETFFDFRLGRPVSNVITHPNFIVNNEVDSIERLRRFGKFVELSENDVIERVRQGLWIDLDLKLGKHEGEDGEEDKENSESDNNTMFIEQSGYYDLDRDGYEEPYTITIHEDSGQVVRIIPRFELSGVLIKSGKNTRATKLTRLMQTDGSLIGNSSDMEIVRIEADNSITKYGFVRDPEGGFLDIGYSYLLGALTSGINATTNQLIDAGTLANNGGGWFARGFRRKMGNSSFRMGQWKHTDIKAEDLATGIYPLPIREPSNVLFSLMQFMISSSQELSASADLSKALSANAPAATTLALVQEQQLSAGAIIIRIYRAMTKEFKKLFILNSKFLDPAEYQQVLDNEEANFEEDFNLRKVNVVPVANPEISSKIQRIQQAEAELSKVELVSLVGGDVRELVKRYYEALGARDIEKLFPDLTPEQQLQKLLSENPDLQQMIMGEQERMDLLAASQADAIEGEEQRKDLEVAMNADKIQSDIDINERKLEQDIEESDTEFAFKMTELEAETGKQLDAEMQSNMLIFDPAIGDFVNANS